MASDDKMPLGEQMRAREIGAYRLHWKSGGSSVTAVGLLYDGTRWFAPANWTTGSTDADHSSLISTDWGQVERAELIQEYRNEMPRPYLAAAIAEAKPELTKRFQEALDKALAEWDGRHVIFSLPVELHDEWGVRFPDNQIELCDSEQDARDSAWNDHGVTVMRRKASNWQEAPDGAH